MIPRELTIELLSDSAFGGDTGVTVDREVTHDETGLPFIPGKSIRGLLRDTWLSMHHCFPSLWEAAARVLGRPKRLDEHCILRIGDALLEPAVREWVLYGLSKGTRLTSDLVLEALTDIRTQTAVDRVRGAPKKGTLRSTRVILRGVKLRSHLEWLGEPTKDDLRVLALCALGTRQAGLSSNRGLGHIRMLLDNSLHQTRKLARLEGGQ